MRSRKTFVGARDGNGPGRPRAGPGKGTTGRAGPKNLVVLPSLVGALLDVFTITT